MHTLRLSAVSVLLIQLGFAIPAYAASAPIVFDFDDRLQAWELHESAQRVQAEILGGQWVIFRDGPIKGEASILIEMDLTGIAARMERGAIFQKLAFPSSNINSNYIVLEVVTISGKTVRGLSRYNLADSVQLLNEQGDLWTTYLKDDLLSFRPVGESLMPGGMLETLEPAEVDALFTYLLSLESARTSRRRTR